MTGDRNQETDVGWAPPTADAPTTPPASAETEPAQSTTSVADSASDLVGEAHPTDAAMHNLHNLHRSVASENGASAAEPCSCAAEPRIKKNLEPACIVDDDESQWPDNGDSHNAETHGTKRGRRAPVPK